jgi:hypothetical protein
MIKATAIAYDITLKDIVGNIIMHKPNKAKTIEDTMNELIKLLIFLTIN